LEGKTQASGKDLSFPGKAWGVERMGTGNYEQMPRTLGFPLNTDTLQKRNLKSGKLGGKQKISRSGNLILHTEGGPINGARIKWNSSRGKKTGLNQVLTHQVGDNSVIRKRCDTGAKPSQGNAERNKNVGCRHNRYRICALGSWATEMIPAETGEKRTKERGGGGKTSIRLGILQKTGGGNAGPRNRAGGGRGKI